MSPSDEIGTAPIEIDLDRAVIALADALDLVGVDEVGHGHRVALMAAGVARELKWGEADRRWILRGALLHDCGVSSTREHRALVNEIDWSDAHAHCERGHAYLSAVPALAPLAPMILEHHSHWQDLRRRGVAAEVALPANLIFLADRADAVHFRGIVPGRPVIDVLARYAHTHFAPEPFAAFRELAEHEAFWFAQDEPSLRDYVGELSAGGERVTLDLGGIKGLAAMFGRIIDAKSPFTERHSVGVARLARYLGSRFELPAAKLDLLEIAGQLHDLGKLRVPDEILEKPGPLSADERRMMARHAFDTWEILRHVFGPGPIARWASFHHEAISGHGYPFHYEGGQLPLEARIIAVADVFQALAQRRPYREPLASEDIAHMLDGMVFGGRLDRDVVAAVKADLRAAWREAVASEV
ncbi:MAG: HD domain-containing protein [Magnetospirillum sp.]|nr:HD domain-containing protein [Magnetospirillum sp.]